MSDYSHHLTQAKAELRKGEECAAMHNYNQAWIFFLRASQELQQARDELDKIRELKA